MNQKGFAMITRRDFQLLAAIAPLVAAALGADAALAQDAWPSRPIKVVIPFPPGGSSDIMGRLVSENIGRQLNASMVVENKPGGTTQIGTEFVANATPDGYTLAVAASLAFTILPAQRELRFSLDNFEVAGGVADYVAIFAVRKALPVTNLREFVDYAKKNPGKLSFGSAGELSAGHVYGGQFARDTGIDVLHVPFRGSADAVNALVAGEVDFVIDGAAMPMAKADRIRPLASFYGARHPELPAVPTLKEAGFDIALTRSRGWALVAPKGTPAAIVSRLSGALQTALQDPRIREALVRGNSIASYQTAADYRAGVAADRKMYVELLPQIVKK
jgi:tripartite-type tricarboxylate transporter receptor subunit TctC